MSRKPMNKIKPPLERWAASVKTNLSNWGVRSAGGGREGGGRVDLHRDEERKEELADS